MSNHFFCTLKIWIEWKREYQLYRQENWRGRLKKKKNRGRVGRSNGKAEKSVKKRQKGSRNVGGSVTNKVGNNEKKSKKIDRMSWK